MPQVSQRLDSPISRGVKLNKSRHRDVFLLPENDNQRPIVVKRYPTSVDALREYEVLSQVKDNPRFPKVYSFFEDDGHWHIAMEYVQGRSLAQIIQENGPLELGTIIDLAIEILQGIATLHESGFVHGDLHGSNVIVTNLDSPRIKIIDFQHSVRKGKSGKAQALRKIRKPHLMLAPESRVGLIDDRYDIYSVGYMCACMLAGTKLDKPTTRDPFEWETNPFLKLIHKAMRPNPRKRYPTAYAMIEALRKHSRQLKRRSIGSIHLTAKHPLYPFVSR